MVDDNNGTPDVLDDDVTVCTTAQLSPGQEYSCEDDSGIARAGLYGNLATVAATFEATMVSDEDASHYDGVEVIDWIVYLPMIIRP